MLTLPFGGVQWWSVSPAEHSVLVTGSPPTGSLCEFYLVEGGTLTGHGPYERACDEPPESGHAIVPAVGSEADLFDVPVRVAGRVVMRFNDASDTRPQYAWYGRSLWIYDVATTTGAEALRFDSRTGALLQRTAMPRVYRPVMVANGDGLWLDPATNGGISGVTVAPLFHVPFGASKPVVVHRGGRAALWMAASAHTVWFEQIAGGSSISIWRVDGTKVQPSLPAEHGRRPRRLQRRAPVGALLRREGSPASRRSRQRCPDSGRAVPGPELLRCIARRLEG